MTHDPSRRRGLLLILSSPSGAGKSTLSRMLMAWDPTMRFSVSATTRAPRPGEEDGREYYFRSRADFRGDGREPARCWNMPRCSATSTARPRAPGRGGDGRRARDTLFDIDWQGGQQIRNSALRGDVVSIFILPPSIAELDRRLRGRGQDSDEVIAGRMAKSRDEISHWAEYDYVLVNDDLDATFDRLKTILTAERLRRDRQPRAVRLRPRPERGVRGPMIYALDGIAPQIDPDGLGGARRRR